MSPEQGARRESRTAAPRSDCPAIVIDADRMEAMKKDGLVIFTGAVVAKLDNATQTAGRMEVYLDEKAERVLRIVSIGNVTVATVGGRKGSAQRAEYSDDDQRLLLLGDAKVWDGEKVVVGEKIAVFLTEEGPPGQDARCARGA